jgi:hypothetical protein
MVNSSLEITSHEEAHCSYVCGTRRPREWNIFADSSSRKIIVEVWAFR